MKTVFNNRELAQVWANGTQDYGRGSNMYFEHDTIYSYGSHFPIAKRVNGHILFNANGYSNTTAKHKNHVARAIGYKYFSVPDCSVNHGKNVDYFVSEYLELIDKAKRARKNKDFYLKSANEIIKQAKEYIEAFGEIPESFENLMLVYSDPYESIQN